MNWFRTLGSTTLLLVATLCGCQPAHRDDGPRVRLGPEILDFQAGQTSSRDWTVDSSTPVLVLGPETIDPAGALGDLSPASEVDLAVRNGTAVPSGPLTPENVQLWRIRAEQAVDLAIQESRVRYQQRTLSLVEQSEQEFFMHVESELRASGVSLDLKLRAFERLKAKYGDQLERARIDLVIVQEAIEARENSRPERPFFEPFEQEMITSQATSAP